MSNRKFLRVLLVAAGSSLLAVVPAAAQGPEVKVTVAPSCEKWDSQFEIVNSGEAWPDMAMITLVRTDTQAVVAQREMRLRPGQRIVYRAREAPDGIGIGLRIEPKWYKRALAYEAVITCSDPSRPSVPEAAQPPAVSPAPAAAPPAAPR